MWTPYDHFNIGIRLSNRCKNNGPFFLFLLLYLLPYALADKVFITKTRLSKYIENFTTKKLKVFR